jgi:PPK2 family polyphosphate:nucleotide phosphotransferase
MKVLKPIRPARFRAPNGGRLRLSDWPTLVDPYYRSKGHAEELLDAHVDEMRELQDKLYAHDRYALLVIFQAMDAAGKDGAIKHVMSGVNPQGCVVTSFRHPSANELDHDFFWRYVQRLPERGQIGIFNRSYYEEVLIVRVHRELLEAERLPKPLAADPDLWEHRYASMRHLEKHLLRNGTCILKFFLHLSREEQRRRFLARIDDPDKTWKLTMADIEERRYWGRYMEAYEACIAATSTKHAPWYIVPADDKPNARLIVSAAILEALRGLGVDYPKPDAARRRELSAIRRKLSRSTG